MNAQVAAIKAKASKSEPTGNDHDAIVSAIKDLATATAAKAQVGSTKVVTIQEPAVQIKAISAELKTAEAAEIQLRNILKGEKLGK